MRVAVKRLLQQTFSSDAKNSFRREVLIFLLLAQAELHEAEAAGNFASPTCRATDGRVRAGRSTSLYNYGVC